MQCHSQTIGQGMRLPGKRKNAGLPTVGHGMKSDKTFFEQ